VGIRVGLDFEPGDEAARRQDRVVAGVVVDRVGVEISAGGLGFLRDLSDAAALRPLEEHVLEDVGDADDVVGLVEVSGLDVGHDRDDRSGPVLPDQHRQTVRQDGASDGARVERGKTRGAQRGGHVRSRADGGG
jgi:hypothetical protein